MIIWQISAHVGFQVLARKGLRVVSINTNYCNNFNFWLALNFRDPHNHLHWLYQELKKAEENRESVYILGHIPTGSPSCTGKWVWGTSTCLIRNEICKQTSLSRSIHHYNYSNENELCSCSLFRLGATLIIFALIKLHQSPAHLTIVKGFRH